MARRKKNTSRKKSIPHPSITGLAGGLIIGNALNAGYPADDPARGGEPHHTSDTVISNITAGEGNRAFSRLSHNARELVMVKNGRKVLGQAIGIAIIGNVVRKWAGNPRLGFGKLYFKI